LGTSQVGVLGGVLSVKMQALAAAEAKKEAEAKDLLLNRPPVCDRQRPCGSQTCAQLNISIQCKLVNANAEAKGKGRGSSGHSSGLGRASMVIQYPKDQEVTKAQIAWRAAHGMRCKIEQGARAGSEHCNCYCWAKTGGGEEGKKSAKKGAEFTPGKAKIIGKKDKAKGDKLALAGIPAGWIGREAAQEAAKWGNDFDVEQGSIGRSRHYSEHLPAGIRHSMEVRERMARAMVTKAKAKEKKEEQEANEKEKVEGAEASGHEAGRSGVLKKNEQEHKVQPTTADNVADEMARLKRLQGDDKSSVKAADARLREQTQIQKKALQEKGLAAGRQAPPSAAGNFFQLLSNNADMEVQQYEHSHHFHPLHPGIAATTAHKLQPRVRPPQPHQPVTLSATPTKAAAVQAPAVPAPVPPPPPGAAPPRVQQQYFQELQQRQELLSQAKDLAKRVQAPPPPARAPGPPMNKLHGEASIDHGHVTHSSTDSRRGAGAGLGHIPGGASNANGASSFFQQEGQHSGLPGAVDSGEYDGVAARLAKEERQEVAAKAAVVAKQQKMLQEIKAHDTGQHPVLHLGGVALTKGTHSWHYSKDKEHVRTEALLERVKENDFKHTKATLERNQREGQPAGALEKSKPGHKEGGKKGGCIWGWC
jgi:hypothetical protein